MRLEVHDLSVFYSEKAAALDHVSFSFENGILGLLGKNGAGKTTLIRTVLGLIRIQSVSVLPFSRQGESPALVLFHSFLCGDFPWDFIYQ